MSGHTGILRMEARTMATDLGPLDQAFRGIGQLTSTSQPQAAREQGMKGKEQIEHSGGIDLHSGLVGLEERRNSIPPDWRVVMVNPQWDIDTPDFLRQIDPRGRYRWLQTYTPAASVRFVAENFRDVEFLEYPTMAEYERELARGIDILGLSFYTYQMAEVTEMVRLARSYGVKEVWGGGWGIDTPGARELFDRSFGGYGEQLLLPVLGDRWKGGLRHPIMIGPARVFGFRSKLGYLYSIRGCKYKCVYCPTPAFLPDRLIMPLSEIERVLDAYAKANVGAVVIYDETFLSDRPYSWQVVDMLAERCLPWFCLASSAELYGNVSKLRDKGFIGCLMGIESLRDKTLMEYKRGRSTSLNVKVLKEMHDNSAYVVGSYIFCHEGDAKATMLSDIDKLASMDIPAVMPTILTPYPPTPPFHDFYDRINDWDWHHWDNGHLVWRHSHVTAVEARQIALDCAYACNSFSYNVRFIGKEMLFRILPFKLRGSAVRASLPLPPSPAKGLA